MINAMPVEVAHRDRSRRLKFWNIPFGARFQEDTGIAVREDMPHEEMFLARMQAIGISQYECDEAWKKLPSPMMICSRANCISMVVTCWFYAHPPQTVALSLLP